MIGLRRQPRGLIRINKSNPIAKGLVCVFVGTSAFDPVTGKRFVNTAKNRAYASNGTVLDAGLGQAKMTFTGPVLNTGSMFAVATSYNNTAEQVIMEIGPEGSFVAGVRGIRFNGGKFGTYTRNFTSLDTPAAGAYAFGVPVAVGATYAGTAGAIYVGGKQVNTGALANMTSSASIFNVGGISGDTGFKLQGHVAVAFVWSRALQPVEMASLAANPYQMFLDVTDIEDDDLIAAVAPPTSYALAAAQGSYTITGNDVGLRVARKLVTSKGTYSLTGNPARLAVARRLVAAPGSYSITGSAANLIKGAAPRALQAEPGSYIITGRPAALRISRRLQAEAGSYVITGVPAQNAGRAPLTLTARLHVLPRNFNLKTIHYST